jgi:alcohol dehydrogenase
MEPAFHFALPTRIDFGAGAVDGLGEHARTLGAVRVLLVTDPGIVAAGHVERAQRALTEAGVEVHVFADVRENPTTLDVDRCLQFAKDVLPNLIVAVGGGSSMDTAKGCNFLLTNGGRMADYWGVGKATQPLLPLIAVPTTAGTGSEAQSFALISDEVTRQKMACGDKKAAPVIAVLDPSLTLTQPRFVAACTGMDAIVHAVETAVTTKRNAISRLFSRESFRLAQEHLPRVLADAGDEGSRGAMLRAACYAGIAIENSMLGAAHSMANPLTAAYDIHHGQAVGMMSPHVVRFNAQDPEVAELYTELARFAGLAGRDASHGEAVDALAARLTELLTICGLPTSLDACGVAESAVGGLAEGAAKQWTAGFNPREVGAADFDALYRGALAAQG